MTTLRACYDLNVSPPTYDAVSFLSHIECERIARGEDSISLIVTPGVADGFRQDNLWPRSVSERIAMRDLVLMPLCRLLPSCETVVLQGYRRQDLDAVGFGISKYGLARQVSASKLGVRPLRAPGSVKTDDKLVTITLRECEHWPERNSNLIEWIKAAKTISARGYRIIFIRDTRFAADQIEGLETAPQASRNIAARAKLYAQAFVNIGISNGPMWMALAMDAAVLMLKPVTDSLGSTHCSSYFKRCGIDPGEQIPGAPIWQRLAWNEDTAIEIVRAFDEYESLQF